MEIEKYQLVLEGGDQFLSTLQSINRLLEDGSKKGKDHAARLNVLSGRIQAVADEYGDASGTIKAFLSGVAESSDSILGAAANIDMFVGTMKKSQAQGATLGKSIDTSMKKVKKSMKETEESVKAFTIAQVEANKAARDFKQPTNVHQRGARSDVATGISSDGYDRAKKDLAGAQQEELFLRIQGEQQLIGQVDRNNEVMLAGYLEQKKALEKKRAEEAKILAIEQKQKEELEEIIRIYGSLEMKQWVDQYEAREKELTSTFTQKKSIEQSRQVDKDIETFGSVEQKKEVEDFDKLLDQFHSHELDRKKELASAHDAYVKEQQKDVENFNKFRAQADAKELKNTDAKYKEQLALAKKYLDFKQKMESGQISKQDIQNRGATEFVDIARGEEIVANATGFMAYDIDNHRKSLEMGAAAQEKLAKSAKDSEKATKDFTLSWQTMGRIMAAQMFNQAFFGLQNAVRSSIKDAEELYKSIAEIQTIVARSADTANNFASAMALVTATSSEINFTPQDTANAFYETLSNQIGDSANEIHDFIVTAGNLGKVTRASLADSSDAISAVINSYSLSMGDAEEVSAKLFTMVDQGRLKLSEVANHMGNVSVPASQLGVDFDNVVGALSAISIAGIPARESMTLLRNIMFKLIDPTEAMTELFSEWGVASADAAVAAFGFDGVIERLGQEALKGNDRVAELMGTIRGTRGVLGLTSENYRKYTRALEQSRISQEEYNTIVENYLRNTGEKFSKLLQQTSNEILQLGLNLATAAVNVAEFFGEFDGTYKVAKAVGDIAKFVMGAGAAIAASVGIGTMITALKALVAFILANPVVATIAAIGGAIVGIAGMIAQSFESAEQMFGRISMAAVKANKEITKAYREGFLKTLEEIQDLTDSTMRSSLTESANKLTELGKAIKEIGAEDAIEDLVADLERLSKALGGSITDQKVAFHFNSAAENAMAFGTGVRYATDELKKMVSVNEASASQTQNSIDKLEEQRKAIMGLVSANRMSLAQSITERNIQALDPRQRGRAQYQAATDAARQAANIDDPEESKKLFDIARKFLRDAEQSAFQSGFFGNIQRHTQFFNQQETELYALQEKRFKNEVDAIDLETKKLNAEKSSLDVATRKLQTELETREVLKDQIDLQLAFIEEFNRKAIQIRTGEGTTQDKISRTQQLAEQANFGVQAIQGSPEMVDAFAKVLESASLQAIDSIVKEEQNRVQREGADVNEAANELKNEKESLASVIEVAGQALSEALLLAQEEQERRIREFVPAPQGSDPFGITEFFNRRLEKLGLAGPEKPVQPQIDPQIEFFIAKLAEFQELSATEEDPKLIIEVLHDLYRGIVATLNEQQFNPEILKLLEGSIGKFWTQSEAVSTSEGLVSEVDKYFEQQQQEFFEAVDGLKEAVRSLDTAFRDYTSGGVQAVAASSEEEFGEGGFDSERLINFLDANFIRLFNLLENKDQQQQALIAEQRNVVAIDRQNAEAEQKNIEAGRQGIEQPTFEGKKSRGQLIYEEQQARIQGYQTNKSRGQLIYEEQQQRLALFQQERDMLIQQQQVIDLQRQNALASQGTDQQSLIGGMPSWMYPGQQITNSVSQGMQEGSSAVSQAVVDGIIEGFRLTQQAPQYFAKGGPVGTDTIPAWLSPGEYVVNARSAAKNFDWLQAINFGSTPRYYDRGGYVENSNQTFTNQFNITSNNPNAQVGAIIGAMRRQISQGKATLSKRRPY